MCIYKITAHQIDVKQIIFAKYDEVYGLIISTFIYSLPIFVSYKWEIISKIKIKLVVWFDIIDMALFVFYVKLKSTWDHKNRNIQYFQSQYKKKLDCKVIYKTKTLMIFIQETALMISNTSILYIEKKIYFARFGFIIYIII